MRAKTFSIGSGVAGMVATLVEHMQLCGLQVSA
jgi:hypothetical protein